MNKEEINIIPDIVYSGGAIKADNHYLETGHKIRAKGRSKKTYSNHNSYRWFEIEYYCDTCKKYLGNSFKKFLILKSNE